MSSIKYIYKCESCGETFHASGVPEASYGEFILRTEIGEESYLEAVGNYSFNEVAEIVRSVPILSESSTVKIGEIIQQLFGSICDLSPNGMSYHIEMNPTCPHCKSKKMKSWEECCPHECTDIPKATQNKWVSMSENEKKDFIVYKIKEILLS